MSKRNLGHSSSKMKCGCFAVVALFYVFSAGWHFGEAASLNGEQRKMSRQKNARKSSVILRTAADCKEDDGFFVHRGTVRKMRGNVFRLICDKGHSFQDGRREIHVECGSDGAWPTKDLRLKCVRRRKVGQVLHILSGFYSRFILPS